MDGRRGRLDLGGGSYGPIRSGGARRKRSPRSRNWCFTDYEQLEYDDIIEDETIDRRYIIAGLETCKDGVTKHIQGFIQFGKQISMTTCKKRLRSETIHVESMRGTCEEASDYCKKEGTFICTGNFIAMGHRSELDDIRVGIIEGKTELQVADMDFHLYCRNYRAFARYKFLYQQKESLIWRGNFPVIVLCGPPRCGKTRLARKYGHYILGGYQMSWWDGYDGQLCIILDDFASDVAIQHMLRVLDGNQLRLECKGHHAWALWRAVVITTNLFYDDLYSQAPLEHRAAFHARVTRVINCFEGDPPMPDSLPELEFLLEE